MVTFFISYVVVESTSLPYPNDSFIIELIVNSPKAKCKFRLVQLYPTLWASYRDYLLYGFKHENIHYSLVSKYSALTAHIVLFGNNQNGILNVKPLFISLFFYLFANRISFG